MAAVTASFDRRYTGQRWEDGLGLYDYHARYYHPALGRFISADTLVPSPGDPQSLNRYAYVRNNPLKYTDPSGHALWAGEDIAQEFDLYTANPMGRGWNAHDTEVVAWTAGTLFVGAGAEALVATGAAADAASAVSWKVAVWASHHPLQAIVGKAVVEESFESAVTGTPFDPRNVLLDVTTQVGDDLIPRRQRRWPQTPEEMDGFMGFEGRRIPDRPSTPGRNKVEWNPSNDLTITYEQHPYHPDAPDFHRLPHWHLSYPGERHTPGARPGTPIPGNWIQR